MTAFTSGPWQVAERFHKDDDLEIIGNIDSVDGDYGVPRLICTHICSLFDNDEQQANARLISAAPDLYAALVKCLEVAWEEEWPAASERARAAIAKAVQS